MRWHVLQSAKSCAHNACRGLAQGVSKEGAGRVAMYRATNMTHCYTLECNYNMGKHMNALVQADRDSGRATPPAPAQRLVPK